jgi:hypothetical protein
VKLVQLCAELAQMNLSKHSSDIVDMECNSHDQAVRLPHNSSIRSVSGQTRPTDRVPLYLLSTVIP